MLCSCRTQYIPVETVRTEYKSKTDTFIQKDSVYVKDSVLIKQNGDTVTITKTRLVYKDRWIDKIATDTVIKTDSIQVPYPVERKLSRWEQFCLDYGKIMFGVSLVMLCALLFVIVRWRSQRQKS